MVTDEVLEENIKYFNKLYHKGVPHSIIKQKISSFEFANEWGTKYRSNEERYGIAYIPLPLNWKAKLKVFPKLYLKHYKSKR